jgi:hypothetical protein
MRVNWVEEEIRLLLAFYEKMNSGDMHKNHPIVIQASNEIRGLLINRENSKDPKFRNPNGIALKMANFLFLDPNYIGKGMKGCSALDKKVFNDYFNLTPQLEPVADIQKKTTDNMNLQTPNYPFDFKKWFSSNIGGVRLPMNNKSGRPIGDQIIEGNIHHLIREMIDNFVIKKGKFLCVLVGGPGNGKTDLMEFASEVFFEKFQIDSDEGRKVLQNGFEKNNRKAKYEDKEFTLNLIQDASQRDPNADSPISSLFNDFEEIFETDNVLTLICINRGVLENTLSKSRLSSEPISKYKEIINKIHSYNNLQAVINDSKIWGDVIEGVNLFTWSMDFDTLFKENQSINDNLIKELIEKSNCLKNFRSGDRLSPIESSKEFLSNKNKVYNLSRLLRHSEILNGKRFTYRELFSITAYLFHHSEKDEVAYENSIMLYEKLQEEELTEKFYILFSLYKKNTNYRFFNYFIEPKRQLIDICVRPYPNKQEGLKQMFATLAKTDSNISEIPHFISSKGSSLFDPIYFDDNVFEFKNDKGEIFELKKIIDKILYNQILDCDMFTQILQPIEIELIKILEKIKDSYCLNIDYDNFNPTQLNGVDLLKTYLNNLIVSIFKRSLLFSNFYIKDKELIKEYLDLVQNDSGPFISVLEESLTTQNRIENSLSTNIGQTAGELKNNVIEKSRIVEIESLPKPQNKMPSTDQIILTYSVRGKSSPEIIVITYNLFKSIKKNEKHIFSACLDKNYLLWQELKKIELSNRSNIHGGEIFIPDMGGKKIKVTRSPFKIEII